MMIPTSLMGASDILFFVATAILFTFHKRGGLVTSTEISSTDSGKSTSCDAQLDLLNSAFVFVKPHANTPATRTLVREALIEAGTTIISEQDIEGSVIDSKKLIDRHYYAIASKATILQPKDIPVPKDKFQEAFGETWDAVLKENRACNAMEACKRFNCSAKELDAAWQNAKKVQKFGGGFYCGLVSLNGLDLYVFNAFFMSMRSKFVDDGASIHCYVVEWDPRELSWSSFRNQILGPTDPSQAPKGSIRNTILKKYKELGLQSEPNKGDNGVHASASPFEGLAEKLNWLEIPIENDAFGSALLKSGLTKKTIQDWSLDPRITMVDGDKGSVFDALEDLNVGECLAKMVQLNEINKKKT